MSSAPVSQVVQEPSAVPPKSSTAKPTQTKSSVDTAAMLKYVAIGLTVVTIVVVTVILLRARYRTEINALTDNLTEFQTSDTLLKNKLREAEHIRVQYANRIKQLTAELSEARSYNPSLPMHANSYDAPDPEAPRQKPQVLKDREAIKSFVNSKRPTVQDEIDDREREAEDKEERDNKRVKFELNKATHASKRVEQDDSESDSEEPTMVQQPRKQAVPQDDKVENIMNIIQSA